MAQVLKAAEVEVGVAKAEVERVKAEAAVPLEQLASSQALAEKLQTQLMKARLQIQNPDLDVSPLEVRMVSTYSDGKSCESGCERLVRATDRKWPLIEGHRPSCVLPSVRATVLSEGVGGRREKGA